MEKKKIELEETLEEFKKNGRKFARCRHCGHLIVIVNGENIEQVICNQIKGLKNNKNKFDILGIANKFSTCCKEPNYRFLPLDSYKDNELIFRERRKDFLSQKNNNFYNAL